MSPPGVELSAALDGRGPEPSFPGAYRSVSIADTGFWRKLGAFAGPGYLVAVGYMDPGNWATDLAAGSAYGYGLLFVVGVSSLLAMFVQTLALRLGIATGRDLAQACRQRYGSTTVVGLWLLAELAIVACNVAEVIGGAVALKLLFDIPLLPGTAVTALDVPLILELPGAGLPPLQIFMCNTVMRNPAVPP